VAPDEELGDVADEPEELLPVPDILSEAHPASTTAHTSGIVHFIIRILLEKFAKHEKPCMQKWHAMRMCRIFQLTKVPGCAGVDGNRFASENAGKPVLQADA